GLGAAEVLAGRAADPVAGRPVRAGGDRRGGAPVLDRGRQVVRRVAGVAVEPGRGVLRGSWSVRARPAVAHRRLLGRELLHAHVPTPPARDGGGAAVRPGGAGDAGPAGGSPSDPEERPPSDPAQPAG